MIAAPVHVSDPGGSWRGSSARPELREAARRYVLARSEDSAGGTAAPAAAMGRATG